MKRIHTHSYLALLALSTLVSACAENGQQSASKTDHAYPITEEDRRKERTGAKGVVMNAEPAAEKTVGQNPSNAKPSN